MQKIKKWVLNYKFLFIVFALLTIGVSCQRYFPAHTFLGKFSYYNNYTLFKSSLLHLVDNKDMYIAYENEGAWDLYKYSPTFPVFMLPYAYLPDLLGLILWNLTNVLLLFLAIKLLPVIPENSKKLMLWFILPELMLSTQSSQSNAIIAALFLLTFISFEKNKIIPAAIFMCIATCIKPYGIITGFIFLFYPGKLKFIIASIVTGIVFIAMPLLLTSYTNLQNQYVSWFSMMSKDFSDSTGLSVMALINDFAGNSVDKTIIIIVGSVITFSTALFYRNYQNNDFRMLFVSLIMIWVVIFNHKSESATFIIPVVGASLWFFSREFNKYNFILLMLVLVFTQLSPSDMFPVYVRQEIFNKFHVKVIPCFIVWCVIIVKMYTNNFRSRVIPNL